MFKFWTSFCWGQWLRYVDFFFFKCDFVRGFYLILKRYLEYSLLSQQAVEHASSELSFSISQQYDFHPSFLLLHISGCCFSRCTGVLRARGSAAVALQAAGRGLQWSDERTRGPTPSSFPATEAEAAAVRQEVCSVLWQGWRPWPDTEWAKGLSGPLRWVTASCLYVDVYFLVNI